MVKDKVVLITNAANYFGERLIERFLEKQAKVIFFDKSVDNVHSLEQKFKAKNYNCLGEVCEIMNEPKFKQIIASIIEKHGTIDVLININGSQHIENIEDFPTETFEKMLKDMVVEPFIGCKYVLPIMKKQKRGRIINMSSVNGLVGFPGKSAYNSARHGVIGLTKVAALEGAEHGITANAICPGYVDTPNVRQQIIDLANETNDNLDKAIEKVINPLVPQQKLLPIEDVVETFIFLASDYSQSITGQTIAVDGGYTAQ